MVFAWYSAFHIALSKRQAHVPLSHATFRVIQCILRSMLRLLCSRRASHSIVSKPSDYLLYTVYQLRLDVSGMRYLCAVYQIFVICLMRRRRWNAVSNLIENRLITISRKTRYGDKSKLSWMTVDGEQRGRKDRNSMGIRADRSENSVSRHHSRFYLHPPRPPATILLYISFIHTNTHTHANTRTCAHTSLTEYLETSWISHVLDS